MTQKFKVGDKVRVVNPIHSVVYNGYNVGDVFKISAVFSEAIETVDGPRLWHREVEKVSKKKERISALEAQVAELTAKVEALEKVIKPKYTLNELLAKTPKSTNEQRKAIIAEAKAFVAEVTALIIDDHSRSTKYGCLNDEGYVWKLRTFFEVKPDKREVTVVLKKKCGGNIVTRSIAKCAPDDVFNADIGKAIALGRALGLDVERFEQAVKPSELVVGHVITKVNGPLGHGRICKVVDGKAFNDGPGTYWSTNIANNTTLIGIDDTDAQY